MKILVTGATGYLGSNMVKSCIAAGHLVTILKRSTSDCSRINEFLHAVNVYDVDTTSLIHPFNEQNGFEAVIHTATCYGRQGEAETTLLETNVLFPLQLLALAAAHSTRFFINTDTSLERNLNIYTLSKKQFVDWGKYFAAQNKIHFINMVVEHFYGPNDVPSKFVSYIIDRCLNNVAEIELTPGKQYRDFLYIDDVVQAYLLLLCKFKEVESFFQEYEVGSGQPVTIRDLVQRIHRLTDSRSALIFGALSYRKNEAMHSCADISALKKLGWQPTTDLDTGLAKTIIGER